LRSVWSMDDPWRSRQSGPGPKKGPTPKQRPHGAGSLYEKVGRWYGRWRDAGDRRRNRLIGPKRKPGTRDRRTKAMAEERLRTMMRADDTATPNVRVTLVEAGQALLQRQAAKGNKKPSPENRTEHHSGPSASVQIGPTELERTQRIGHGVDRHERQAAGMGQCSGMTLSVAKSPTTLTRRLW
jgi:hypothetical protein